MISSKTGRQSVRHDVLHPSDYSPLLPRAKWVQDWILNTFDYETLYKEHQPLGPKQLQGDISHQLQNSTWESLRTKGYKAQLDTFPKQVLVDKTVQSPWVSGSLHKSCLHLHPWSGVVQLHVQPLGKPPHFEFPWSNEIVHSNKLEKEEMKTKRLDLWTFHAFDDSFWDSRGDNSKCEPSSAISPTSASSSTWSAHLILVQLI